MNLDDTKVDEKMMKRSKIGSVMPWNTQSKGLTRTLPSENLNSRQSASDRS